MNYIKGDFTLVPNRVLLRGKSSAYRSVFLALCDYANDDGICFPSLSTLEQVSSVSKKTLIRTINEMIGDGILSKTLRKAGNENASNLYQLVLNEDSYRGGVIEHQGSVSEHQPSGNIPPVTISTELYSLPKGKGRVKNSPPKPKLKKPNEEINMLLGQLRDAIKSEHLDGSVAENRKYANLLIRKFGFLKAKEIISRAPRNKWHRDKISNMKYVYYHAVELSKTRKLID